jgi:HK97 gp10 family phage protein
MADDFIEIDVTGLGDAVKGLNGLKDRVAKYGLRQALTSGITVLEQEVKRRTPRRTGLLAEMCASTVRVNDRMGGTATVNFGSEGYVARLVETGHRIHKRVGTKGKLPKPGTEANSNVDVEHVPAKPFMRPAFEEKKDEAIAAFAETLADVVEQASTIEGTHEE